MRHFKYERDFGPHEHGTVFLVRCMLNGREIASLIRVRTLAHMSTMKCNPCFELDDMEQELRAAVDRMDPEVLL